MRRLALLAAALLLSACTPQQAIALHFGHDPVLHRQARSIAACESGWNPHAISRTGDHGLMQVNAATWAKPGHPDPVADFIGRHWHQRYDPVMNAYMAKLIQQKYGWSMWSCRP